MTLILNIKVDMKKLILLFLTTLLIVSCAKNNGFEYSYEDVQRQNFEQTFIKTFGQPSSDQDWGFASAEIVNLSDYNNAASRAVTRGHNVNRNQWERQFSVPANVTATERDLVVAEFSKYRPGVVNNCNVNWTDVTFKH